MMITKLKEVQKPRKNPKLIKNSIKSLQKEFDKYIEEMEEVPWLYNERAVLGFYIAGLIRNTKNLVLQEFSCNKGKTKSNKGNRGRADIWFQYNNQEYLAETKLWFSYVNTDTDCNDTLEWAQNALIQANQYNVKPWSVKKSNVFSLCFEVIFCTKKNLKQFRDIVRKEWCDVSELNRLDFYYLIELNQDFFNKTKYFQYQDKYYPAVAVYGLFNKRKVVN
jgi:hypothetical protein